MLTSVHLYTIVLLYSFFANLLGLSVAIGAFVGGLTLAALPYSIEIIGQVRSLGTFFMAIFFVSLGLNLAVGNMSGLLIPFALLLLLAIILKPLILMILMSVFGYKKRPSFLIAISLA